MHPTCEQALTRASQQRRGSRTTAMFVHGLLPVTHGEMGAFKSNKDNVSPQISDVRQKQKKTLYSASSNMSDEMPRIPSQYSIAVPPLQAPLPQKPE